MAAETWPEACTQPIPGGELVYRRIGRRQDAVPDLILLHGLLGAGSQWRDCADILAAEFNCWVLELPGISASSRLYGASLPQLARWLDGAIRALGVGHVSVLASSWGGGVALQFAADYPAKVERLVLAAPVHPGWRPNLRQRILLWRPATRAAAMVGRHLSWRRQRALLEAMYGDPRRVSNASVHEYRQRLCRPGLGGATAGYVRHWRRDLQALEGRLGGICQPVLLVWGERDMVVPVASARGLQAALREAQLVGLSGLGHLPFEEDPAAFAAAALPFLRT